MPAGRVALWVASVGAIALTARSIFGEPLPLSVALGASFLYVALIVAGVLIPTLEMFGDVICRGDPATGAVALTFDDGPHPITTARVLRVLERAGVKATFFVVGAKVERYPDVVRAIARAGHAFGAHGFRHDKLYAFLSPSAVAEDIRRTADAVEAACGERPRWFRPPVGQVSPRTIAGARRSGLEIVGWSVRGLDGLRWTQPDRLAWRIERGLSAGAIVLLHDASESEEFAPATVEVLPRLLETIRRRDLRVVSLDELLEDV